MTYISFFLFIYFILIKKVIEKSNSIQILFKKEPSIINNDFILSNYIIDIYISFQISNEKQNLQKVFLKSDTNEFMISNSTLSISNHNYNAEISSSSKKIVYSKSYNLKYTSRACVFKDKLFIPNSENNEISEFDDITFLYANNFIIEKYPAIIGLKLVEQEIRNVKSFPYQINELEYTNNATWMIKYNNDDEGIFYFGDIFNKDISPGFNPEKYRKTNAVVFGSYLSWDLTFSQIISDGVKISGPMQAFLDFNFGLISCSEEYYNHINNEFFNQYIKTGKCNKFFYNKENPSNQIKLGNNFTYIVCDKSIKIKNFPEIEFFHSALDYTFKLTYEDLFTEFNNKIYFLVIKEVEKNERWKIGKIFFKKYNIIFDHNYKTIGIYDDKYNKSNTALIVFEWILAIFLVMIVLYLGYILYKRYRLNNYKLFQKRMKVEELEQNLDEIFKNKNEFKNNDANNEKENDSK